MVKCKNWFKKLVLSMGIVSLGTQAVVAQPEEIDTAIIGAGLAGLTAGYYLQKGIKIYEARNRPGGRVFTSELGELGGQDLDEGHTNHIKKLCQDLGLELKERIQAPYLYTTIGGEDLQDLVRKEIITINQGLVRSLMEREGHSLKGFLDSYFREHPISPKLRRYIDIRIEGLIGASPGDADYYYGGSVFEVIGSLLSPKHEGEIPYTYLPRGNSSLIERLTQDEKLAGKIQYKKNLIDIAKEGDQIKLTFSDGHIVLANHIILSLPFSTLRHVKIQPGLIPEDQLEVIHTLPYGTNSKILLPVRLPAYFRTTSTINPEGISWVNPLHPTMTLFYGGTKGALLKPHNMQNYIEEATPTLEAAYPGLAEESGQAVSVNWSEDPFSLGSYSYKGPGQLGLFSQMGKVVLGQESVEMPHPVRPVGKQIIFAGEHTAPDEIAGNMDGAIASGMAAAKILELLTTGGQYEAPEAE